MTHTENTDRKLYVLKRTLRTSQQKPLWLTVLHQINYSHQLQLPSSETLVNRYCPTSFASSLDRPLTDSFLNEKFSFFIHGQIDHQIRWPSPRCSKLNSFTKPQQWKIALPPIAEEEKDHVTRLVNFIRDHLKRPLSFNRLIHSLFLYILILCTRDYSLWPQ